MSQLGSDGTPPSDPLAAPGVDHPDGTPTLRAEAALVQSEAVQSEAEQSEAVQSEAERPPSSGQVLPRGDGRRIQRIERQHRRRLALACAVVIALCFIITILIVGLARNRPLGSSVVPPAVSAASFS